MNLAAIYRLPVVFVIENNGYGEATPFEYATRVPDLAVRAQAYGMPGVIADGMDFRDVFTRAGEAIARARAGEGPTLLECKCYRYYGHYVGDPLTYRSKDESDRVRSTRDPLDRMTRLATDELGIDAAVLAAIDAEVEAAIAAAVRFAETSAEPEPAEVTDDVYVRYETEES